MGWVSDLISLADAGDSVVQDFECSHGRVGCGLNRFYIKLDTSV